LNTYVIGIASGKTANSLNTYVIGIASGKTANP